MPGLENAVQSQLDLNHALMWIFSVAGILGNIYLLAFKLTLSKLLPRKIHPQYYRVNDTFLQIPQIFLIHLCIANLFGAIYLFIMANTDLYFQQNYAGSYSSLAQFSYNTSLNATSPVTQLINSTCTVARFFSIISLTVSVLITLIMAIDRSICLYYPKCRKRITFKTAHILMLGCWSVGSTITIAYCIRSSILMDDYRNPIGHVLQRMCIIGHHTDQISKFIIWIIISMLSLIFLVAILLYINIFTRKALVHQHLRRRQYEMRIVWLTSCMMLIQI